MHPNNDTALLKRPVERRNGNLWCPISEAPMSTEFANSRFCVPFLHLGGWALFADCDMLMVEDVQKLFDLADDTKAVMVVKHDYDPGGGLKMDSQPNVKYNRKNWSSLVLWNCSHNSNRNLTLEALNTWPGRDLHAFKWLDDAEIGELPQEWNFLVGINQPTKRPICNYHYTIGGPWFDSWGGGLYDDLWTSERKSLDAIRQQVHDSACSEPSISDTIYQQPQQL
jgi:lipopolysaccharide biosynthesis glycosyltransferase